MSRAVKLGALGLLTVQNSALSLVMAHSRVPDAAGHVYLGPTAVFLVELLKVLISLGALFYTRLHALAAAAPAGDWLPLAPSAADADEPHGDGKRASLWHAGTWRTAAADVAATLFERSGLRLAIPALLYVCQNNLQLVAASHMDGALLQTFSQGKLISTAFFATLMLHKKLSRWQWTSVATLALGVILVQQGSRHGAAPPPPGSPPPGFALSGAAIGLVAIATACIISGFAGVYTEMILKGQAEFWAVNAQLSAFSLVPALIPLLSNATDAQGHWAPMRYFGAWAWASVLLNVSGGLLVSLVVKVADNVAKGFAVALAIVLTFIFSTIFLAYSMTLACAAGVAVVVLSMVVYSTNPPPKPAQDETVFEAHELGDESRELAAADESRDQSQSTDDYSPDQSMDERSWSPPHLALNLPTHEVSKEDKAD